MSIQRKPHHKGFKKPTFEDIKAGWGKKGKGAKRNTKNLASNKKRFIKEGIDCCQMCGSTEALSNSHTHNSDRRDVDSITALLCIWPCHDFLQKLTAEERVAVNEYLINTNLEGETKFEAVLTLLPNEKAEQWRRKLLEQRLK